MYGGDLVGRPGRSEWEEDTLAEVDYDFERVKRHFEDADVRVVNTERCQRHGR